ncbi:Aste57867_23661 [Aphanomyces stellatus]|uniref:Aste57867_23661 protein n=1 Tax=Aphanomyces stellatus TaxID=120398 RepID=A0A485LNE3_9STRA|nr:hypothetical protein As57867_023589 [Aphanomyces stellatus]VFU00306.1 Aste57867_23661 [Aphanomyces stellatus]
MQGHRVHDTVVPVMPTTLPHETRHSPRRWESAAGVVYLGMSIVTSLWFMRILASYLENDLFWTDFNATGAQAFVADVVNRRMWNTTVPASVPLFDALLVEKDYATPHTVVDIQASDARRIAWEQLNNPATAIVALRAQSTTQTAIAVTCYCWLDFGHVWETAHTAARQARCLARYVDNGAVYMEAMLRNTAWAPWQAQWGPFFDVAYGNALRATPAGPAWLNQTTAALPQTSVDAELQHWRDHNITRYSISWSNGFSPSLSDGIVVQNAWQSFTIPIKHLVQTSRGALWTSVVASYGVWNDFNYAADVGASLVRSAADSFVLLGDANDPEQWIGVYPNTMPSRLLHAFLGPLGAIDLTIVALPPSLWAVYTVAAARLDAALCASSDLRHVYDAVGPDMRAFRMAPPRSWQGHNWTYIGGNPFCLSGVGHDYIQENFGFDDGCSEPFRPLTIGATRRTMLLALVLQSAVGLDTSRLCAVAVDAFTDGDGATTCDAFLAAIVQVFETWVATGVPIVSAQVVSDVARVHIESIQYVLTENGTSTVLRQGVLDGDWAFFGWLVIVDWIQGTREVLSFEGDVQSVTLISAAYAPTPFRPDPLGIPFRFSSLVWYMLVYFSGVLTSVVGLMSLTAMLFRVRPNGRNLMVFNVVAGVVWIGRPLLMLRGLVAMAILSTAPLRLELVGDMTSLVHSRRPLWDTLVVAGESLWFTYALCDIMLLFMKRHAHRFTALSSLLAWVGCVGFELLQPIVPSATMMRTCSSSKMEQQMDCTSGVVVIGQVQRFIALGVIQIGGVVMSWVVLFASARRVAVHTFHDDTTSRTRRGERDASTMVPSIAYHLMENASPGSFYADRIGCVISGFVPLFASKEYIFNVLLWMVFPVQVQEGLVTIQTQATLRLVPSSKAVIPLLGATKHRFHGVGLAAGVVFLLSSAVSSILFFYVSDLKLANDFLWEDFNSTGMHTFVAKWYNFELLARPTGLDYLDITNPSNWDTNQYNSTVANIQVPPSAAMTAQYEATTLLSNIRGLRQTDGCEAPWIGTSYCFVDFDRRWEMANTAARQRRCTAMVTNGAVFLESIVRNTNVWTCWAMAFDVGFRSVLQQSSQGRLWLQASTNVHTSPEDEVAFWVSYNISAYTIAWHNYKSLGIIENLAVRTTFSASHALTIKNSNGSYRFNLATSLTMYWGFGNDLLAITQNGSLATGQSLIRGSAGFAFQNDSTMESLLVQNNSLAYPLDGGKALLQLTLGPFGSIDLIHVPCPQPLLDLYRFASRAISAVLANNVQALATMPASTRVLHPVPQAWLVQNPIVQGGNLFCPSHSTGQELQFGMVLFFGHDVTCSGGFSEYISSSVVTTTLAMIATGHCRLDGGLSIGDICSNTTNSVDTCKPGLKRNLAWVHSNIPNDTAAVVYTHAQIVQASVLALNVEIMQYVRENSSSPVALWRMSLLDPNDPYFKIFAWHYLGDWAMGEREVVSFAGDNGVLTLMSSQTRPANFQPSPLEIPSNVAYYSHICIQYTTSVTFIVATVTAIYSIASQGCVEGGNLFVINRVAGIVWMGRPLLLLRSLVATALLSTGVLKLNVRNGITFMDSPRPTGLQLLLTFLAGLEISWLQAILSDVAMVFTGDHTASYTTYSSVIVSATAVMLTVVAPVKPTLDLSRSCDVVQMDFQVVCRAGTISIGSPSRFGLLCGLTASTLVVCFLWDRWYHPKFVLPRHRQSLWLPACGYYLYRKGPWIFDGILFLDKASAFMSGLVSFKYDRAIYLLDIKTWRMFTITIDAEFNAAQLSVDRQDQEWIDSAIPMLE